jgi:Protein of unknown function (DUF2934)
MSAFDNHRNPQTKREEIERRAYEIYLQRGGASGGELDDWLIAEREILGAQERPERSHGGSARLGTSGFSEAEAAAGGEKMQTQQQRGEGAAAGDRSSG